MRVCLRVLQVVPILRAGLVLLEQASTVLPASETYHVGYVRNEETLQVSGRGGGGGGRGGGQRGKAGTQTRTSRGAGWCEGRGMCAVGPSLRCWQPQAPRPSQPHRPPPPCRPPPT